jgi:uncharacterized membrane protein HdeD (DUF308 family)
VETADTASVKSAAGGLLLGGILFSILGIIVLAWPDITAKTLVILFGVFLIIYGVSALIGVFTGLSQGSRFWAILLALVAIGFGIACFTSTDIAGRALLFVIGAFAIARGVIDLLGAVIIEEHRGMLILTGAINLILGLIMVTKPEGGALILIALVGAFFILSGVTMIVLGFAMRSEAKSLASGAG